MPSLKAFEERLNDPASSQVRLPNFEAGPGRPRPVGVNFYEQRDYYPGYLLCSFDVNENHYDPSKESEWFKTSLSQIRNTGSSNFPPFKWVALIICNRAEHKGISTFEQSYKVGAIFSASEVFKPENDLWKSIAQARMDRHPFQYDPKQPSPGEQARWLIVERHEAANKTNAASVKP